MHKKFVFVISYSNSYLYSLGIVLMAAFCINDSLIVDMLKLTTILGSSVLNVINFKPIQFSFLICLICWHDALTSENFLAILQHSDIIRYKQRQKSFASFLLYTCLIQMKSILPFLNLASKYRIPFEYSRNSRIRSNRERVQQKEQTLTHDSSKSRATQWNSIP